jgi:UDP-N-acetylmuramyl pentapeptide phosphotransferase/UDP-N-acetylglucosamine-1-phosphate transferase
LTVVFFAIFFLSLLFSFILTRYVRDVASRRGWVAIPSDERHLHASPLPRLGGVAIFISFSLTMVAAAVLGSYLPHLHSAFSLKTLLTILAPASVVFLLGVYDDLYTVGPYVKFAVQHPCIIRRAPTALVCRLALYHPVGPGHHQRLQLDRWPGRPGRWFGIVLHAGRFRSRPAERVFPRYCDGHCSGGRHPRLSAL